MRRTLRQGVEVVAGLVHRDVAAVAEDDAVGRLTVAAAAHRAQRIVILACVGIAGLFIAFLGLACEVLTVRHSNMTPPITLTTIWPLQPTHRLTPTVMLSAGWTIARNAGFRTRTALSQHVMHGARRAAHRSIQADGRPRRRRVAHPPCATVPGGVTNNCCSIPDETLSVSAIVAMHRKWRSPR